MHVLAHNGPFFGPIFGHKLMLLNRLPDFRRLQDLAGHPAVVVGRDHGRHGGDEEQEQGGAEGPKKCGKIAMPHAEFWRRQRRRPNVD